MIYNKYNMSKNDIKLNKKEFFMEKNLTLCFTGHRPSKLPWGGMMKKRKIAKNSKQI